MNNKQTTIKDSVSLEGVGIHTGKDVKLTFRPAKENTGYIFKRVDLDDKPEIEALAKYVVNTQRGTTLEKDGVKLKTTEHVLAALVGLEIDNILIEINAEEDHWESATTIDENRYASEVSKWVDEGASIIAGCCRTRPSHIKKLVELFG